jgi:hypothetical protein
MNTSAQAMFLAALQKPLRLVKFVFKRRFTYQLFTVYIPTFCLLVIMQLTHYYPPKGI